MERLGNLYKLGSALLKSDRRLTAFRIHYKGINCHVLFHRLLKPHNTYWTIHLSFFKVDNIKEYFECYANKNGMDVDANTFYHFFNIKGDGHGDWKSLIENFYSSFNKQITDDVINKLSDYDEEEKNLINTYISNHEREDERNKVYLFDVRHTGHRTEYNNDKAACRYPEIYQHFKTYTEYSFFFSDDVEKETTLEELIIKFERRR